jgi:transposase
MGGLGVRNWSGEIRYKDFGQLSLADIMVYEAIPPHPFWSAVDEVIDFSFSDELCAPLYSPNGQRPYAPSLKLKVHLVQRYYDISDREMEFKIVGDIFVKRFLGLPVTHAKFDHSTIGLDRSRLGAEVFQACHNHILAQAMSHGLWGDDDDRWLVDSFHTYARVAKYDTYGLIRRAVLKVIRHMKHQNPPMYQNLKENRNVGSMLKKMNSDLEPELRVLAFSSLVVHAYGLLVWIERENTANRFPWSNENSRATFDERVALLQRVLQENTQRVDNQDSSPEGPAEPDSPSSTEGSKPEALDRVEYRELPRDKKPPSRIVSVDTPDVRAGTKSKGVKFVGDKIQVVESAKSRLVLHAEPIPGNEADGEKLISLVQSVIDAHKVFPAEVVADSAYGSGENRYRVQNELNTPLVSPVPQQAHKLLSNEKFSYQKGQNQVVCPEGKASYRRAYNKQLKGTQFFFRKQDCQACPLQTQCTTSHEGRAVFFSDHWELIQEGKQHVQSEAGKAAMKERREIERTNNEMKNHHGMVRPRTHGRDALRIDAIMTAITVNVKVIVKSLWHRSVQNRPATC